MLALELVRGVLLLLAVVEVVEMELVVGVGLVSVALLWGTWRVPVVGPLSRMKL